MNEHARQSFLGEHAQQTFGECRIAVVGLGGGGSHIVQQLAHVGFLNFDLFDPDVVEDVNLNRLVGANRRDVARRMPKTAVARRVIRGLEPHAKIRAHNTRWQESAADLKSCDIVFGCLDGYSERDQLEAHARRYFVPYIDIGMDVHSGCDAPPAMSGQVILSAPGMPCMRCMSFITEEKLGIEAAHYGAAGARPQVVWPNGVLASTAVGIAIDLLTDWTRSCPHPVYLSYDGNTGTLKRHVRLDFTPEVCEHYPITSAGDPQFSAA